VSGEQKGCEERDFGAALQLVRLMFTSGEKVQDFAQVLQARQPLEASSGAAEALLLCFGHPGIDAEPVFEPVSWSFRTGDRRPPQQRKRNRI
jgi:hypothetical protein